MRRRSNVGPFAGAGRGEYSGKQWLPGRFVGHGRSKVFQFLDGNGRGELGLLRLGEEWRRQKINNKKAQKAKTAGPQAGRQPQIPLNGVNIHSRS